ncbi:hypothetical protein C7T94_02405 [Pedobacter yulinensis]|uniref:Uncharacterized protein n=1 Tax=Pedobacter yulinensis TaxID=2126353 RepID=A0A2T3HR94_9SPHI|nr:hypothetical protein C7T94_02405 [Pedobacter yulinensis]
MAIFPIVHNFFKLISQIRFISITVTTRLLIWTPSGYKFCYKISTSLIQAEKIKAFLWYAVLLIMYKLMATINGTADD